MEIPYAECYLLPIQLNCLRTTATIFLYSYQALKSNELSNCTHPAKNPWCTSFILFHKPQTHLPPYSSAAPKRTYTPQGT